jgi:hypothetical protein
MQLAAAFVEYLITGTVALVWLLPVLAVIQPQLPAVFHQQVLPAESMAVILLAGTYVVGILLDSAAYRIMRQRRKVVAEKQGRLNKQYLEVLGAATFRVWDAHALTWMYAPELAKTLQAYSTRDRITRGIVLNLWIAAAVYLFVVPSWIGKIGFVAAFLTLSGGAYAAWSRYQRLSRKLKKNAVMTIVTKEMRNSPA